MLDAAVPPRTPHSYADDPRRLRDVLARVAALAEDHRIPSVIVGLTAQEGDRLFPDLVAFVESELRVEDSVFRLTRERAMLFLSDVDPEQASSVVERLLAAFQREFAARGGPVLRVRYLEVPRGTSDLSVKRVLPAVFASEIEDTGLE